MHAFQHLQITRLTQHSLAIAFASNIYHKLEGDILYFSSFLFFLDAPRSTGQSKEIEFKFIMTNRVKLKSNKQLQAQNEKVAGKVNHQ